MITNILHSIIEKLDSIGVPYMLSGSVAMGYYTVSRSTRDIDFVIYLELDKVDAMELLFKNDYFNKESVVVEVKKKGMFNVILQESSYKIDFIIVKDNEYGKLEFSRRKLIDDFEKSIYVVSVEDLIINKLRWIQQIFSDRQYNDIENLIMGNKLDMDYLNTQIKKLRLNTFQLFENEQL
jgi:hypothetical protein